VTSDRHLPHGNQVAEAEGVARHACLAVLGTRVMWPKIGFPRFLGQDRFAIQDFLAQRAELPVDEGV
jgi:hypothetical protein